MTNTLTSENYLAQKRCISSKKRDIFPFWLLSPNAKLSPCFVRVQGMSASKDGWMSFGQKMAAIVG
jgi:hypothetical protein